MDTSLANSTKGARNGSYNLCVRLVQTQSLKKSLFNSKLPSIQLILICKILNKCEPCKTLREMYKNKENP